MIHIKFATTYGYALVMALASLGACAAEHEAPAPAVDESADEALNLLTRVRLDSGNLVEFYEPRPGSVLISESGADAQLPLSRTRPEVMGLSPAALYQALTAESAPEALVQAERRGMMARVATERPPREAGRAPTSRPGRARNPRSQEPPSPGGIVHETGSYGLDYGCSPRWFEQTFCSITQNDDWNMCLLNKEGYGAGYCGGADDVFAAVCANIGNVTMRVMTSAAMGGAWTVFQGYWRFSYLWGTGLHVSMDIDDSWGDAYHATMGCLFFDDVP